MRKTLGPFATAIVALVLGLACQSTTPTDPVPPDPNATAYPVDPSCIHTGMNTYTTTSYDTVMPAGKMHFLQVNLSGNLFPGGLGVFFSGPVSGQVHMAFYKASSGNPTTVIASGETTALSDQWTTLSFPQERISKSGGKFFIAIQPEYDLTVRCSDSTPIGRSVANTYGVDPTNPSNAAYFTSYTPYQYVTICTPKISAAPLHWYEAFRLALLPWLAPLGKARA